VANMIAIDWGTSSFRAFSIDDSGKVLQRSVADEGILSVESGTFEHVLEMHLGKFPEISSDTPIIAAGMITSKQGWCETPYVQCPASAGALADNLICLNSRKFGKIWFVPGVSQLLPDPDIMRGEESQLAGIRRSDELVAVMPGTHSKWVEVNNQTIVRFKTFMTGELYSIVMKHSILRSGSTNTWSDKAFKRGVQKGFSFGQSGGGLLSGLFRIRVETILGQESEADSSSHVSGLLIGCEIGEAVKDGFNKRKPKLIIGESNLAKIYHAALLECGITAEIVLEDVSGYGLYRIAKQKKLI